MTEPLYTYEYETAGGAKHIYYAPSDIFAIRFIKQNNNDLIVAAMPKSFQIIKLTNTHTKEVIYDCSICKKED